MKRGFTLIELIVVMSIIGTLIGIAFSSYTSSLNKGRDARRKTDLKQIQIALEKYKNLNGFYPKTGWVNSAAALGSDVPWIPDLTSDYIDSLPVDPKNVVVGSAKGADPSTVGNYIYAYYSVSGMCGLNAGNYYILATRLENPADYDASSTMLTSSCNWPSSTVSGVYAVSNP